MKILKRELKTNLKSFIIWSIAASLMAFLAVSVFDSVVKESAAQWEQMIKAFPKELLAAFQITEESFSDPLYFYSVKGYLYVVLIISIFTSMLGLKLINKEEVEGTTEFILTKPVSRFQYITEKMLTLLILTVGINLVTTMTLYFGFMIGVKNGVDINGFLAYCTATFLISLLFGIVSFLISTISKRNKGLTGISIGIVMLSFILGILSNLSESIRGLRYFSIFEYYNANEMLKDGLALTSVLLTLFIIVISVFFSYKIYLKKDIYN